MNPVFQYTRLTQLWHDLKTMQNAEDAFRHLDNYFKYNTTIEGNFIHNTLQTHYLVGYVTREKRLTLSFTLTLCHPTHPERDTGKKQPTEQIVHTAINLTPDTFYTALKSTEQFMSLFY